MSHTDIRYDSRILNELDAISEIKDSNIHAIGVEHLEGKIAADLSNKKFHINTLRLRVAKLKKYGIPGFIRHPLTFIELMMRTLWVILKKKPTKKDAVVRIPTFITLLLHVVATIPTYD